jgi:hypothetical protein
MVRRVTALALASVLAWPGAGVAQEQEDEGPPMLMISSWMCDFGRMDEIREEWESQGVNAAQRAVDSGAWMSAGVFYHSWSDEWNVNYWAVGSDIASLIEGQETNNAAYQELNPDGGSPWELCSEHKDGFYRLAMGTDSDAAPGPAMAISSWKCTDVAAVADAWNDYGLAKAQAVVDAGTWNDAGIFFHAWADAWNVNYYYMADDIPAILEGWETFVGSMGDDAPDITDYCTAHKDGFYEFGTTVTGEE